MRMWDIDGNYNGLSENKNEKNHEERNLTKSGILGNVHPLFLSLVHFLHCNGNQT